MLQLLRGLFLIGLTLAIRASAAEPAVPERACCAKPASRLALLTGSARPLIPATERPNLVFLLADDLRWDSLGCMGNPVVQTPNLDRLAARGTLFRNHFATTSICCVSRASIFSGQYERRHGIGDFKTPFSAAAWAETYPVRLRQAGYRTGFIGKFGVGNEAAIKAMAGEFDYWKGLPGQAGTLFIDPQDPLQRHATARFGEEALEFLAGSDASRPFCLSVSFNAPHARDGQPREFQPDLRDEALYGSPPISPPPAAALGFFERLPDFVQRSEGRRRWEKRFSTPEMALNTTRDYFRLITGIDREVGRIVEALEKAGQAGRTIIVFTSDNGFFLGDRGLADKWYMYEESIRLPLIVFDPRPPALAPGRSVEAMTLNVDLAPTLLAWAGLPAPARMQGQPLQPLLAGETPAGWRTEFFYEHHYGPKIIAPSEGVRTERWSYLHWLAPNPEREELYEVQKDPLEAENQVANPAFAATLKELRAKWQRYGEELK